MNLARILLALIIAFLGGCATSPFDKATLGQVDRSITYDQAVTASNRLYNRQVLFGGVIVATRNLAQRTEMVILAYPLDRRDRPDASKASLGRFVLAQPGYLEPVDYAPGRLVSVMGRLDGLHRERLEGTDYLYPVVQAQRLYLWPQEREGDRYALPPWLHIGIGIGFGL